MKATWNGATLAESDDTLVVEGNHYFPADSLDALVFHRQRHTHHVPVEGRGELQDDQSLTASRTPMQRGTTRQPKEADYAGGRLPTSRTVWRSGRA